MQIWIKNSKKSYPVLAYVVDAITAGFLVNYISDPKSSKNLVKCINDNMNRVFSG